MKKQKSKSVPISQKYEKTDARHKEDRTGKVVRSPYAVHMLQTAFRTARDQETNDGRKSFLDVPSETLDAKEATGREMLYKGKKKK